MNVKRQRSEDPAADLRYRGDLTVLEQKLVDDFPQIQTLFAKSDERDFFKRNCEELIKLALENNGKSGAVVRAKISGNAARVLTVLVENDAMPPVVKKQLITYYSDRDGGQNSPVLFGHYETIMNSILKSLKNPRDLQRELQEFVQFALNNLDATGFQTLLRDGWRTGHFFPDGDRSRILEVIGKKAYDWANLGQKRDHLKGLYYIFSYFCESIERDIHPVGKELNQAEKMRIFNTYFDFDWNEVRVFFRWILSAVFYEPERKEHFPVFVAGMDFVAKYLARFKEFAEMNGMKGSSDMDPLDKYIAAMWKWFRDKYHMKDKDKWDIMKWPKDGDRYVNVYEERKWNDKNRELVVSVIAFPIFSRWLIHYVWPVFLWNPVVYGDFGRQMMQTLELYVKEYHGRFIDFIWKNNIIDELMKMDLHSPLHKDIVEAEESKITGNPFPLMLVQLIIDNKELFKDEPEKSKLEELELKLGEDALQYTSLLKFTAKDWDRFDWKPDEM